MKYEELVKDFTLRTKKNLSFIKQALSEDKEVYEVTQLINSMLGLFVFPQQKFYNKIPKTPLSELEKSGWPVPRVKEKYIQAKDLKTLARYLRNGIAHFNLRFTESDGHVDGLIIWNERNRKKNWEAEIKIDELEGIINKFTDLLID